MSEELEKLLSQMPLRAPSAQLDKRIEAAFWNARWQTTRRWVSLASTAVAAAVAVMVTINFINPKTTAPAIDGNNVAVNPGNKIINPSTTVRMSRDVSQFEPAGVVRSQDGTLMRAYRRVGVQDLWIVDPKSGQMIKVSVPQNDTILMPSNFD